jgi:hypothetical protein
MKRYDPAGFDAAKGILIGLVLSFIMLLAAGFSLKLMWRAFMFGWGLV